MLACLRVLASKDRLGLMASCLGIQSKRIFTKLQHPRLSFGALFKKNPYLPRLSTFIVFSSFCSSSSQSLASNNYPASIISSTLKLPYHICTSTWKRAQQSVSIMLNYVELGRFDISQFIREISTRPLGYSIKNCSQ